MRRQDLNIIWIEGLCPRTGEKVLSLVDGQIKYTTSIRDCLRVRDQDIEALRHELRRAGIANWVVDGDQTFVRTTYARSNTIWVPPNI